MSQQGQHRRQVSGGKFLRVVGILWVAALLVILIGALLAPHLGRLADVVLQQTVHRAWTRLSLRTDQPFFDLSTPALAVKSYYSALFRGDTSAMERLTVGPFREQMQQRLTHAEAASDIGTYRSYLRTEMHQDARAIVQEKFHLFWQRGLRYSLRRHDADWRIVGIELVR
jgi:hypothetical protein